MSKVTITESDPDETGPGLILTAAGQRAELRTAAHALDSAAHHVQRVLVLYPADRAALAAALADVTAQVAVLAGLLAAEVAE